MKELYIKTCFTFSLGSGLHKSIEGSSDQGGRLRIQCHIHDDLNKNINATRNDGNKNCTAREESKQMFEGDIFFVFILCSFVGTMLMGIWKLSDASDHLQFPQLFIH